MASSTSNPSYSASGWTERTFLNDMTQQKWLLIGLGCFIGALWLYSRRSAPEEQAARRLVRDWRQVDDVDDARDLLSENIPPILKPALLSALDELHNQVHHAFRQVEREINRL